MDSTSRCRSDYFILISILCFALVLRLWGIGSFPYGIWHDEAQNSIETKRILYEENHWPVFVADRSQMAALPFYIFTPFVKIFPDDARGVRIPAALIGVASIAATWLLTRYLFGSVTAHIAAFLLAGMRWHLTFSRFGMAMIFTSLFIPLIIYLFLRALDTKQKKHAVIAGIAMGIGLQTYYAMISLPVLLFTLWLYMLATRKTGAQSFTQVGIFICAALVSYSPVLYYAWQHWTQFTYRFSSVSAHSYEAITTSAVKHLGMFHMIGDANGRHNFASVPMLDPITGILFVIGLLWLIFSLFNWRSVLLMLWVTMSLCGGVLSIDFEAPQAARTFGITPAIALITALPLSACYRFFRIHPRLRYFGIVIIALLGIITYLNVKTFFIDQRYSTGAWGAFAPSETKIGQILRAEGTDSILYAPAELANGSTQDFFFGTSPAPIRKFSRADNLPFINEDKKIIVFFAPSDTDIREQLVLLYPHASFEELMAPTLQGGETPSILTICRISVDDIKAAQGWQVSYPSSSQMRITGMLRLADSGNVVFSAPNARSEVKIFGTSVNPQQTFLAQGSNVFEWNIFLPSGKKEATPSIMIEGREVSQTELFNVKAFSGGLLGEYFAGMEAEGVPGKIRIDPLVSFYFHERPLDVKPYTIKWRGKIHIPETGTYEFGTSSIDQSFIFIDKQLVLENAVRLDYHSAQHSLQEGWHDIEILFRAIGDYNQIYLYWKKPADSEKSLIPSSAFLPAMPGLH